MAELLKSAAPRVDSLRPGTIRIPLSEISLLVLDADGVILDTPHEAAWRKAAEVARGWAASSSAEPFTERFYVDRLAGRSRERGAAAVLELLEIPSTQDLVDRLAEVKQSAFRQEVEGGNLDLFADAVALINSVAAFGIRVVVVTSSRNAAGLLEEQLSDRPGVRACIDFIAALGDVHGATSKRGLIAAALERTGVAAARTVYIDDSLESLRSAEDLDLWRFQLDRSADFGAVTGEVSALRSLAAVRADPSRLEFDAGHEARD